jgi:hypothetical protein
MKQAPGKTDVPMVNCVIHRPTTSHIHCDDCFQCVERYYTDIPILQAQIETLTAQNDLLRKENYSLKANAERKTKRIKTYRNIVIKNATSVKEIINYELSVSSVVNF